MPIPVPDPDPEETKQTWPLSLDFSIRPRKLKQVQSTKPESTWWKVAGAWRQGETKLMYWDVGIGVRSHLSVPLVRKGTHICSGPFVQHCLTDLSQQPGRWGALPPPPIRELRKQVQL